MAIDSSILQTLGANLSVRGVLYADQDTPMEQNEDQTLIERLKQAIADKNIPEMEEILKTGPFFSDPRDKDLVYIHAIQKGNADTLRVLEKHGWSAHFQETERIGPNNRTALSEAAAAGNIEAAKYLISEKKSPVNFIDSFGETALFDAIRSGQSKMVEFLLDTGADATILNNQKMSPLTLAINRQPDNPVPELLIKHGAKVDIPNENGLTPLMEAARNGNEKLFNRLLELGAEATHRDAKGNIALHYAVYGGSMAIVKKLMEMGQSPDYQNNNGETPFRRAVLDDSLEAAAASAEQPENKNNERTEEERANSRLAITELFLKNKSFNPPWADRTVGEINFVQVGNTDEFEPHVGDSKRTVLKEFIDGSVAKLSSFEELTGPTESLDDLRARNTAQLDGQISVYKRMTKLKKQAEELEKKTRPPAKKELQKLPEGYESAVIVPEKSPEQTKREEEKAEESRQENVKKLAKLLGEIRLLENDAKLIKTEIETDAGPLYQAEVQERNFRMIRTLLDHRWNPNHEAADRETPFIAALNKNHLPLMKLLLNYGANINLKNQNGDSPLMYSIDASITSGQISQFFPGILISLGANPNMANNQGETPLSKTLQYNIEYGGKLFEPSDYPFLLLEYGANPDVSSISVPEKAKPASDLYDLALQYKDIRALIYLSELGLDKKAATTLESLREEMSANAKSGTQPAEGSLAAAYAQTISEEASAKGILPQDAVASIKQDLANKIASYKATVDFALGKGENPAEHLSVPSPALEKLDINEPAAAPPPAGKEFEAEPAIGPETNNDSTPKSPLKTPAAKGDAKALRSAQK